MVYCATLPNFSFKIQVISLLVSLLNFKTIEYFVQIAQTLSAI